MSTIFKSILNKIQDPSALLLSIWTRIGRILPGRLYLSVLYRLHMGYWMSFKHPSKYTEKLQWLKLYDHNPLYTILVDKYEVKKYIAKKIGQQHVVPTYGIWDNVIDIKWENLPNKFVAKATHDSGGIVICHNKSLLDINKSKHDLSKSLSRNFYYVTREWPYKFVKPRIIVEQLLESSDGDIKDYKFYCFNGIPKLVLVASYRFTSHNFDYFDMDFKHLDIISRCGEHSKNLIVKPDNFDEMKELAVKLSAGIPHVRVDLYNCDGKIYFGELTFYDSSGFDDLNSEEWNQRLGDWIKLPTHND